MDRKELPEIVNESYPMTCGGVFVAAAGWEPSPIRHPSLPPRRRRRDLRAIAGGSSIRIEMDAHPGNAPNLSGSGTSISRDAVRRAAAPRSAGRPVVTSPVEDAMKKLTLNLDRLSVESFPTTPVDEVEKGTVHAMATRELYCTNGDTCRTSCGLVGNCTCPV